MPDPTETRKQLIETIQMTLHRIGKALHRSMRGAAQTLPLTLPQLGVLGKITQEPGLTVSELARDFMMAKSNISGMVDRLDREGLLEKMPDAADQRLIRLRATEAGQETLQGIWARRLEIAQAALSGLSDEELTRIAQSMELLYEALTKNLTKGGGN